MGQIVAVEPLVTFVAEVRSAEESSEGIANIVMAVFLDEINDLVTGYRSSVDDHMRWIDGHDFDLDFECNEQGVTKMASNLIATKHNKQTSQVHAKMKVKLEQRSDC